MTPQSILISVSLAFTLGTLVGFVVGRRRGRDEQWCDSYFERVRRTRARPRDGDGKFAARKGGVRA